MEASGSLCVLLEVGFLEMCHMSILPFCPACCWIRQNARNISLSDGLLRDGLAITDTLLLKRITRPRVHEYVDIGLGLRIFVEGDGGD